MQARAGRGSPHEVTLTDEQQRIVEHNHGPAIVFAVAGAGKTTTLVHRVERLVREGIFRPERILTSSFSRATVADLKRALSAFPHTQGVHVKTLHGLSYQILRHAKRIGIGPNTKLPDNVDAVQHTILNRAFRAARRDNAPFIAELDDLDREDFLTYVGSSKATLAFTNLRERGLPKGTPAHSAKQPANMPWYLALYQLYEQERHAMQVLTFDDLLPEAWALFTTNPAFAQTYQERFDAVIVDEFQDTNISQVALLDILVQRHKNYMVCGDDDQAIYGFRMASNRFLLNFAKQYKAEAYVISDSFRCHAEHTILANHVITRNKHRAPKTLTPARGFGGQLHIDIHPNNETMAKTIAQHVGESLREGHDPAEIAILVRLYAETGAIEHALIDSGIPYDIVGNAPFYERLENQLLIKYLRLGMVEHHLATGSAIEGVANDLAEVWWDVLRTPSRYIRRDTSEMLLLHVMRTSELPSRVLMQAAHTSRYSGDAIVTLGETVAWLGRAIGTPHVQANTILQELEQKLNYKQYLINHSGFTETGQGRAQNVEAFIQYAQGKGHASTFVQHLENLRHSGEALGRDSRQARMKITTVFRAKGLEWPHVIVPAINYGHYPAANPGTDLSEERRLFYVALTRTKHRLDLHVVKNRQPSIFMEKLTELRQAAITCSELFVKHPADQPIQCNPEHAKALLQVYEQLERYLSNWCAIDVKGRKMIEEWLLAAHEAAVLAGSSSLPKRLVMDLAERASLDTEKVRRCAHLFGIARRFEHRIAKRQRDNDSSEEAISLAPGKVVRHRIHGEGVVLDYVERGAMSNVEVHFDNGRRVKLLVKYAGLTVVR